MGTSAALSIEYTTISPTIVMWTLRRDGQFYVVANGVESNMKKAVKQAERAKRMATNQEKRSD